MGEEALSLMDDLESAWDNDETTEETPNAVESKTDETESPSGQLSEDGADSGYADSGDSGLVPGEDDQAADLPNIEASDPALDQPALEIPDVARGLPPEAREQWKNTPKAVQDAIAKREADYAAGIEKHRHNSQRAQQMDRALAPFQQYLGMTGAPPAQTIGTLLQTASMLQMGSEQQKAQQIAQLVKQFDVSVPALDGALVGAAPSPEDQQVSQIQQAIGQAVAPYQQHMAQMQQVQQQQAVHQQQLVQTDIQKFAADPKNEFYNDVALDMADVLDMAANRNRAMSLPEAYDQACQLHPQIGKILSARNAAKEVANRQGAAASISGSPGGPGGGDADSSMRDLIETAWDSAGRD